ncbi:hypothetical protein [Actinomadura gamaensis]|uniref:Uncharacterized protein n=1 Tax=Actinomadura gamaensis TaxID=1763541 RepID=A0ABV9TSU2_9ACTN
MTALILIGTALAALLGWLCSSPIRLAGAGAVLLIAHPVPVFALTVAAVLAVTTVAARMLHRSLREGGWWLVTVERPAFAVSRAAGVAS